MLEELFCIFCGNPDLILRHIDLKVYQVSCTDCGGAGPYGECMHDAEWNYRIDSLAKKERDHKPRH